MSDTLAVEYLHAAYKKFKANCYPQQEYYYVAATEEDARLAREYMPGTVVLVARKFCESVTIEQIEKGQGR